tara:strand:- start:251 stop:478 length:228 start_codon:yes stop_codon:yes gene_type:complete
MRNVSNEEADKIEEIIDSVGLSNFISALSDICGEKADHIRSNSPAEDDLYLSRMWLNCYNVLNTTQGKIIRYLGE